jgi:integrase
MRGARPLSDDEIVLVSAELHPRDQTLLIFGVRAGFRISEILSLSVGDVYKNGKVLDRVYLKKSNTKGKDSGRSIPIHQVAKVALLKWIEQLGFPPGHYPLFVSRKARPDGTRRNISRVQAWRVLEDAYRMAGLEGQLGTHAMRKTFAKKVYARSGKDLLVTQKALGHGHLSSTVKYLGADDDDVDRAISE